MSKSSPPVSSIESLRKKRPPSSPAPSEPNDDVAPPTARNGKTLNSQFAAAVRWLHIYVSLLGFTALTFFAVTGITLNHPTWFGIETHRTTEHAGEINKDWLNKPLPPGVTTLPTTENGEPDYALQVAKLEIVEQLRSTHKLRGIVTEFKVYDFNCLIMFRGPGYSADADVDRATGKYQLTETVLGTVAVINDLHKGRDTGPVWSVVIDVSALLMIFVSITGTVLIFYIKRKRWSGIITAVVGTIVFAAFYVWFVP